jgi:hypothetical protein
MALFPESVAAYGDENPQHIAAELLKKVIKGKDLRELHKNLRDVVIATFAESSHIVCGP